ncbi:2118_t:CDS:1, partial [Racocetra persica]
KAQDQLIKVHFSTGNNVPLIDKLLTALQGNTSLEEMDIFHTSLPNTFFHLLSTCKVLNKLVLIGCKQHDQPFNLDLSSLQIIHFFCKNNIIHPENLRLLFSAASSTLTTLILDTAPLDVLSTLSPRCRQLRHLVLGITSQPYDLIELLQDLQNLEYLTFCHVSKRFVSIYHHDFYVRLGPSLPIFLQHLHTEYIATPDDVMKFFRGCIAPITILGLNQPCGINKFHLIVICEFIRRKKFPLKTLQYDGSDKEYIIKSSNFPSEFLDPLKEFLTFEVETIHPFDIDRWSHPR